MTRERGAWAEWDADRNAGLLPTEMARQLADEELARLLSEAGEGRDDERKLLATEALRRTTDLEQARHERTLVPDRQATAHRLVVNNAAERIHAIERRFERASAAQVAKPDLKTAHESSLKAEEHRAHVETGIELHAEHREEVKKLHRALDPRKDLDED